MLLAIDAGNTNVVFAILDGDVIRAEWRASTTSHRTADEYWVWLNQLMGLEGIAADEVDGVIISSVVPQAVFSLRTLCRRFFKLDPMLIGDARVDLGIPINLPRPEVVGADRLVNAVAAHRSYAGALIIIDFGTATTFDVVSEKGAYEGGVIAPGVNLSLEALNSAAAKLPRIAVERPEKVIGRDTVPAMQSGVFWGYTGLIEGLIARIRDEYAAPMTVIATGGLASLFNGATDVIQHLDHDLTIRGLKLIYERNRPAWVAAAKGGAD